MLMMHRIAAAGCARARSSAAAGRSCALSSAVSLWGHRLNAVEGDKDQGVVQLRDQVRSGQQWWDGRAPEHGDDAGFSNHLLDGAGVDLTTEAAVSIVEKVPRAEVSQGGAVLDLLATGSAERSSRSPPSAAPPRSSPLVCLQRR